MNKSPRVIGYWARVHGLSRIDCMLVPELRPALVGEAAQHQFREGQEEATSDILREKLDLLKQSLTEAAGCQTPSASPPNGTPSSPTAARTGTGSCATGTTT